jgi:hypothetical protein
VKVFFEGITTLDEVINGYTTTLTWDLAKELLKRLSRSGLTSATMYPDYESVGRAILEGVEFDPPPELG